MYIYPIIMRGNYDVGIWWHRSTTRYKEAQRKKKYISSKYVWVDIISRMSLKICDKDLFSARLVWEFSCVQSLCFGHGTHATVNTSFSFFFFFTRFKVMRLLFMHCCMNSNCKCWLSIVNSDLCTVHGPTNSTFQQLFH